MFKFFSIIALLLIVGCSSQQNYSTSSNDNSSYNSSATNYENSYTPRSTETVPSRGCVSGNCDSGIGTYIYKSGGKYTGNWSNGKRNGRFNYTSPSGEVSTRYYAMDENVTEQVENCQTAISVSNSYGAFVGGVNALLSISGYGDKNPVSAYNWGKNAASKQTLPKAVRVYCN